MKRYLLLNLIAILLFSSKSFAQTFISGNIATDSTWTLAASPYIITDTTRILTGATLTIEPGVTVKFANGKYIEIYHGKIDAVGTASDSIIFTSNSLTPYSGIWDQVHLNLDLNVHVCCHMAYCKFMYARYGLYADGNSSIDSVVIENSTWQNCTTAIYGGDANCMLDSCDLHNNGTGVGGMWVKLTNSTISHNGNGVDGAPDNVLDHCIVRANQIGINYGGGNITYCIIDSNTVNGIYFASGYSNFIENNNIRNNGIGLILHGGTNTHINNNIFEYNSIGFRYEMGPISSIQCNKFCNNNSYDVYNDGSGNINLPGNYWCTSDSSLISHRVGTSYYPVTYMPVDIGSCGYGLLTSTIESEQDVFGINIYPNPNNGDFILSNIPVGYGEFVRISELTGRIVFEQKLADSKTEVKIQSDLNSGLYIWEIVCDNKVLNRRKFVVQK